MELFEIIGVFGNEKKVVSVDLPAGAGGYSYHVSVDGFHHGVIMFPEQWPVRWHINPNSELCTDDILLLVDEISWRRNKKPSSEGLILY